MGMVLCVYLFTLKKILGGETWIGIIFLKSFLLKIENCRVEVESNYPDVPPHNNSPTIYNTHSCHVEYVIKPISHSC